jgi:hypothetical protein
VYDYRPGGVASDSGLIAPENASGGAAGLSHTVYCTGPAEQSQETETEEPSSPPSDEPSSPPSDEPSSPPSDEPSSPPSEEPSFEQSFEAETDVPTEPPTSTITGGTSGPADGAWLLVVALGVFLASVVVLTPARAKNR